MIPINNLRFEIEPEIDFGKEVRVFPFRLVNGITNLTNNGERDWNAVVNDYNTFSMVLNGKENVIAVWNNSTTSKKDTDDWTKGFQKEYKVGDYYTAWVLTQNAGVDIVPVQGQSDFTSLEHFQSFNLIFKNLDIQNQDLYFLYVIPELGNYQWLKISNVNKYYKLSGELAHTEITFETIGSSLSFTGGIRRQFINFGSPGEGYAFPFITEKKEVKLDAIRLTDTPITSIQVKCMGGAGMSSIYAYGRPVFKSTITEDIPFVGIKQGRIIPSRRLLPLKTLGSIVNKISLENIATENYYFVHNSEPMLQEIYNNWKSEIGDTYNSNQKGDFQGGIALGKLANVNIIKQSNLPTPETNNKFPNVQKNNPIISIPEIAYEVRTSPNIDLSDGNVNIVLSGKYNYGELLSHMGFINDGTIRVPNSIKNNTVWSFSRLPIIGGFLNDIVLGADFGWNEVTTILPTPPIGFFFPTEYIDIVTLEGTDGQNVIPMELFTYGQDTSLTQLAGVGNTVSSWRVELTDQINDKKNSRNFNSLYLGQRFDQEGNEINFKWNNQCSPLVKSSGRPNFENEEECLGYIIDYINIKMFYSGDYTITFFNDNNDTPIAIGEWLLSSKGKNTSCIREWNNEMFFSFWKEGFTTNEKFDYPKEIFIPPPNPTPIFTDLTFYSDKDLIKGETIYNADLSDYKNFALTNWESGIINLWSDKVTVGLDPEAIGSVYIYKQDPQNIAFQKAAIQQSNQTINLKEMFNSRVTLDKQQPTLELALKSNFKRIQLFFSVTSNNNFKLNTQSDPNFFKDIYETNIVCSVEDFLNNNFPSVPSILCRNGAHRYYKISAGGNRDFTTHINLSYEIKIMDIKLIDEKLSFKFEFTNLINEYIKDIEFGKKGLINNPFALKLYVSKIVFLKN